MKYERIDGGKVENTCQEMESNTEWSAFLVACWVCLWFLLVPFIQDMGIFVEDLTLQAPQQKVLYIKGWVKENPVKTVLITGVLTTAVMPNQIASTQSGDECGDGGELF